MYIYIHSLLALLFYILNSSHRFPSWLILLLLASSLCFVVVVVVVVSAAAATASPRVVCYNNPGEALFFFPIRLEKETCVVSRGGPLRENDR